MSGHPEAKEFMEARGGPRDHTERQGVSLEQQSQMGQIIPKSTSGSRDNTTVASKCCVEKERIPDGLPSLSPPKGPTGPAGRGGQGEAEWVRRASGSHLLLPGEG